MGRYRANLGYPIPGGRSTGYGDAKAVYGDLGDFRALLWTLWVYDGDNCCPGDS